VTYTIPAGSSLAQQAASELNNMIASVASGGAAEADLYAAVAAGLNSAGDTSAAAISAAKTVREQGLNALTSSTAPPATQIAAMAALGGVATELSDNAATALATAAANVLNAVTELSANAAADLFKATSAAATVSGAATDAASAAAAKAADTERSKQLLVLLAKSLSAGAPAVAMTSNGQTAAAVVNVFETALITPLSGFNLAGAPAGATTGRRTAIDLSTVTYNVIDNNSPYDASSSCTSASACYNNIGSMMKTVSAADSSGNAVSLTNLDPPAQADFGNSTLAGAIGCVAYNTTSSQYEATGIALVNGTICTTTFVPATIVMYSAGTYYYPSSSAASNATTPPPPPPPPPPQLTPPPPPLLIRLQSPIRFPKPSHLRNFPTPGTLLLRSLPHTIQPTAIPLELVRMRAPLAHARSPTARPAEARPSVTQQQRHLHWHKVLSMPQIVLRPTLQPWSRTLQLQAVEFLVGPPLLLPVQLLQQVARSAAQVTTTPLSGLQSELLVVEHYC